MSASRTPPANASAQEPRTGERIAKLLARAGVASRREVERMIAEGRVKIGDVVVTTPATVLANLKGVSVDGKPVKAAEPARLFVFHKPSGLITAERDPAGRPTIYTALRNALPQGSPRVMPIGRLDFNTEGLLLLTNDGELKRAMELPSSGVPRTYRARTFGAITQAQLEELIEGIEIDGVRYGKIDANMERSAGRNQWIELTLTEGKNREVRRVLEHFGLEVSRLLRTSYGPFALLDLPRGAAIEVRQVDVERFRKGLKTPGGPDISHKPQYISVEQPSRAPRADAAPADRRGGRRSDGKPLRPDASPRGNSQPRSEGRPFRSDAAPRGASQSRGEGKPYRSDAAPRGASHPRGEGKPYRSDAAPRGASHPRGEGKPFRSDAAPRGASHPRGEGKPFRSDAAPRGTSQPRGDARSPRDQDRRSPSRGAPGAPRPGGGAPRKPTGPRRPGSR